MRLAKNKGFTLVELLIVMAIVIIMIVIMIGVFNPREMVNRGNDARRRGDVGRIKTAFEDYYTGKKCYPDAAMVAAMMDPDNCGKVVVSESGESFGELVPWRCDSRGTPYYVIVGPGTCPKWFKVLVLLADLNSKDIPASFLPPNLPYRIGDGTLTTRQANYGGSSTNVRWDDIYLLGCEQVCNRRPPNAPENECNIYNMGECTEDCFAGPCDDRCRVPCCGPGCSLWDQYVWGYY